MAESLYVCQFSNGHIKVGRSATPEARIRQHAERVACVGVRLLKHHFAECAGSIVAAEVHLIARCAQEASHRNKSEWFEGLDFADVCEWLAEAIAAAPKITEKSPLAFRLRPGNFPPDYDAAYVCRACSSYHDASTATSAFLCDACAAEGYSFDKQGLHLNGEAMPLWAKTSDGLGVEYPGVPCEELRPDVPWLRIRHEDWAIGKPLIDYSNGLRKRAETALTQPLQSSIES